MSSVPRDPSTVSYVPNVSSGAAFSREVWHQSSLSFVPSSSSRTSQVVASGTGAAAGVGAFDFLRRNRPRFFLVVTATGFAAAVDLGPPDLLSGVLATGASQLRFRVPALIASLNPPISSWSAVCVVCHAPGPHDGPSARVPSSKCVRMG